MKKVFKMNEYDCVCAKSVQEAKKYYIEYSSCEEYSIDFKEIDIETECMWYGFDLSDYSRNNNRDRIYNLFKNNTKLKATISKDKTGSFDVAILIPYKYVIEFDEEDNEYYKDNPYIISSTEF